ncbi:Serine carboxypeptidase (plasmid) [Caballeronia sp. SBC1]|nr:MULTISPECIES: peptidase S10 [unclassified Caballeronia]QIE26189.1 Serine carboxypeptidase [Caballeronia sp. SBC2]QIN64498.1 Serine carboxypeptidase [Caballeronia sp. SBC1]
MRSCFYPMVSGLLSGLIVLGLASGPSVVLSQETSAAPADTSVEPAETQGSQESPAGTPVQPDAAKPSAQANARAASDANANPARRNRASAARTSAAASDAASETKADTAIPVPPETTSVTQHSIKLGGRKIDYTATAGNLLLRNNAGQAEASVFYVAYTANTKSTATRPITFLFNGGPGAGSIFLLMGSFGPERAHTSSPAITAPAPYVLSDNPDSLLDTTDLVFVDAPGAGFSRIVGHATGKRFWGVDEDLDAFEHFIERYLSVNQRWNSPKYLLGESYGTARAAMLAYRLSQNNIALNGVVLMSSILNPGAHAAGTDLESESYLPTYAAIAWYHDKIVPKPPSLPAFLDEVRAFASGPYAQALAAGDSLPDSERDAIAARVAHYTGLDVNYVKQSRLQIWASRFRKQLLIRESRTVGRYDARFEGMDYDDASEHPDYDASVTSVSSAFDAALHEHLAQDLHFEPKDAYRVFNDEALKQWNWKHRQWWGEQLTLPYAAGDLAEAMRQNPRLRVLSLNGYFDLATPFFQTEYDLAHMGLDPSLRPNVQRTYYPTGHMIYLDDAALHSLKSDLVHFYNAGTAEVPKGGSQ